MLRSPLLPIFLTVFVDVLGLTIVLPLLPYYAEHFGATPFEVTLIAASYAACQFVSGPILGRLSDRVGRKPVLVVSQIGTLFGFLVLAFANSLWMLFVGRIIDGCTAGNLSIAQAYISDVTKPENRTKAFGIIGIAFGLGFTIGPAISGAVAARFGFGAPLFAAAALSLTSILTTATLLPRVAPAPATSTSTLTAKAATTAATTAAPAPSHRVPTTTAAPRAFAFRSFFSRPAPRKHLLEFFAFVFSFTTLVGGLALFLERRMHFDVAKTGYVYAVSGIVGGSVQGGIGKLVKRLGEGRLAAVGFVCMAVGYVLLGFVDNLPLLGASIAIASVGSAVVRPCLTTMLTKSVGTDEQGAILGVSQSLSSIASMTANPISGLFIGKGLLLVWALIAAGASAVGVVMRLTRDPAPALEDAPPLPST